MPLRGDETVVRESAAPSAGVRRAGLLLGLCAFGAAVALPTAQRLRRTASAALEMPPDAPEVTLLAAGAQRTLGLAGLMACWWATEAVPLPVTSLLPGFALPLLAVHGVEDGALFAYDSRRALSSYSAPVIFLFLAGFVLAAGLRRSGLDRRVALFVLTRPRIGRRPAGILLGVMAVTAVLSMWISNTATTAMMVPIALGIAGRVGGGDTEGSGFRVALMLGVAWAACLGGIGTLIGTPPNGIAVGVLADQAIADLSFLTWLGIGLPVAVICTLAAWALLIVLFRPGSALSQDVGISLESERAAMGRWSVQEITVGVVMSLAALLWITQPVWERVVPLPAYVHLRHFDAYLIGLGCAVLLFIVPVDWRRWRAVLDWGDARHIDWGTLLLFGGGIALSRAIFDTRLADALCAGFVERLGHPPAWVAISAVALAVSLATQLTSNTALVAMVAPVLIGVAGPLGVDTTTLVVVAAVASSCAFILPVSTPPNALVYGAGQLRIGQMAGPGALMTGVALATALICLYLFADRLFGILRFT